MMKLEKRFDEFGGKAWDPSKTMAERTDALDLGCLLPTIRVQDMLKTESDLLCYGY